MILNSCKIAAQSDQNNKISLYSGDKSGTFFIVATKICNDANKNTLDKNKNLVCEVIESKGSLENLYHIKKVKNSFSIIKDPEFYQQVSNINYDFNTIKIVKKTHDEFLTILVNKKSKIQSLQDLNGKRVNIGYIGSGNRVLIEKYFSKFAIKPATIFDYGATKTFKGMENDEIDAWVYFNGHPNPGYSKLLLNSKKFEIIPLSENEIKQFESISKISKKNILDLKGFYGVGHQIKTISSETFLATDIKTSQEVVNFVLVHP